MSKLRPRSLSNLLKVRHLIIGRAGITLKKSIEKKCPFPFLFPYIISIKNDNIYLVIEFFNLRLKIY